MQAGQEVAESMMQAGQVVVESMMVGYALWVLERMHIGWWQVGPAW